MLHEKRKEMGAVLLFVLLCCCLTGCSFSFCGFPLGDREELIFTCEEGLPEEEIRAGSAGEEREEARETPAPEQPEAGGKVNINTAGLEELMTLNGVGESRARAIIEYREANGPFQKEEDIMQIPGIKEGIFSKIKEQIAVQ